MLFKITRSASRDWSSDDTDVVIYNRRLSPPQPLRTPHWRWSWAVELHSHGSPIDADVPDAVRQCVEYLFDRSHASTPQDLQRLRDRFPELFAAHQIYLAARVVGDEIDARLLAGQTFDDIEPQVAVPASVIAAYAYWFYDVVDYLECTDWLLRTAVRRVACDAAMALEGDIWRYMSLAGGRFVLQVLVADYFDRPEPIHVNRSLLARQLRWLARDQFDCMDFGFRLNPQLMEEGMTLFADFLHRECVIEGNRTFANQVNLLRYLCRLPAKKEFVRAAKGIKQPTRRPGEKQHHHVNKESNSWMSPAPMD